MPFDENSGNDPIEGLGKEILPSRGMPFEDVRDEFNEDAILGDPRDVTPEELAGLFENVSSAKMPHPEGNWLEMDSGMRASEPIMTEADFEALDLPAANATEFSFATGEIKEEPVVIAQDAGEGLPFEFVTREQLSHLWARIDQAQLDIREKVPNLPIAKEMIEKLELARNQLLMGKDYYEEAERTTSEVELRVAVIERAKADNGYAIALFLYEVAWAIGLVTFFIAATGQNLSDQMVLVQSAVWGGLGGISGAFYALWKHVSRDVDFSKQYALWYVANPISGMLLGAFVFLVTKYGLLSLFSGSKDLEISSPFVIYILAYIVGYQQNVAWDLMRRILKVFQLGNEGKTK